MVSRKGPRSNRNIHDAIGIADQKQDVAHLCLCLPLPPLRHPHTSLVNLVFAHAFLIYLDLTLVVSRPYVQARLTLPRSAPAFGSQTPASNAEASPSLPTQQKYTAGAR